MHTMKDEFMIVSGMPERNGDRHVSEIASMALDLLAGLEFRKNIKVFFTRSVQPDMIFATSCTSSAGVNILGSEGSLNVEVLQKIL